MFTSDHPLELRSYRANFGKCLLKAFKLSAEHKFGEFLLVFLALKETPVQRIPEAFSEIWVHNGTGLKIKNYL